MIHHRRCGALMKTSRRRGAIKRGPREVAGSAGPVGDSLVGLRVKGAGSCSSGSTAGRRCSCLETPSLKRVRWRKTEVQNLPPLFSLQRRFSTVPTTFWRSSGYVLGQTTSDSPLLSQVTQSAVKPQRDQNQELVQRQEPLLEGYPSGFSLIPMERGWNPGHREYCRG